MNRIIPLKDNYSVHFTPNPWDRNIKIWLSDDVNNVTTALTLWEGGRWKPESYNGVDKFFEIVKHYPKVKRALRNTFAEVQVPYEHTKTATKTLKCFQRRFHIEVYKILKVK